MTEIESNKNDNFSKYKQLLDNLLKQSFENKLKNLEKSADEQLSIISSTNILIKNVTSVTVKMHNQILAKLKKDKPNTNYKHGKQLSIKTGSPKSSLLKKTAVFKTPIRSDIVSSKPYTHKGTITSKKDLTLKRTTTNARDVFKKEKSKCSINNKKFKTINTEANDKYDIMYKTSITWFNHKKKKDSIKPPASNGGFMEDKSSNILSVNDNQGSQHSRNIKNAGLVNKMLSNINKTEIGKNIKNNKNLNKTYERRKSNLKSESLCLNKSKKKETKNIINIKGNNININNDTKRKSIVEITNHIINNNNKKLISMETDLQKDNSLFHDDPLLISPITDYDFHQNGSLSSNKNRNIINDFFIINDEKNLKHIKIFEFLCFDDLIKLKCVSKYFNKTIMNYFLNNLIETKQQLEIIKNTTDYNPEPKNLKNLHFSAGSEKSIELLNDTINNFFFQEENPPKNNDVLFVYKVFFQLINNHIIINVKNNKNEFWDKCRFYFLNEGKGKIGDLLRNIINNNEIDLSMNNLYQIYKLVNNKLNNLLPSNFKNICSTTPFFAFYIKDILSFLGISSFEEEVKKNGYWTYSNIINSIDDKISLITKYK